MRSVWLLLLFLLSVSSARAVESVAPPAGLKVLTAGHSFHVWMPPLVAEMAKSSWRSPPSAALRSSSTGICHRRRIR
jgi:hypothetical protein